MARPRSSTVELARLLNSSDQPIYALDDQATIVFCNRACLEWLGLDEAAIVGRRCAYHSEPDVEPAQALAAGLCPPPSVWEERETMAVVCVAHRRRTARFIPLGNERENVQGLVAIVQGDDLPDDMPPPTAEPTSAELHERIRQCRRLIAARYRVDLLLGESPAARRIRAQVQLSAIGRPSVLIFGPPGSGRQHVATTIHYAAESAGALIPLACSVLSPEMIVSTIGALVTRGDANADHGPGTLLLNDVDQLTPDVQGTLASLLDIRSFPLRVMATARRPLVDLARHGEFRADLAGALSTIVIELPPLAERREDIPLLAHYFLEQTNARSPKQFSGFTAEALDRLDAYPWPGNGDELAKVVAEARARAPGPEVAAADLPQRLHLAAGDAVHPRRKEEPIVLDEFLGRVERELIRRALERSKGNKAKAARLLGLTRPRLYRRLVQLGMEEASDEK